MKFIKSASMAAAAAAVFSVGACDLLDVENPNNIVEDALGNVAAASAIVNGAEATVARGHGQMLGRYATVSNQLFWIGSRDAWDQLDAGNLSDPANEFTDSAFPQVAEGRWMADNAVSRLEGFLADDPGSSELQAELGRANAVAGISYMFIGTMFDDYVFSDKTEPGQPVGAANMASVLMSAVSYFDAAIANAGSDADEAAYTALRARAKWEAAAWAKANNPTPSSPLVSDAGADADAMAALAGLDPDWRYQFTYAPAQVANDVSAQVNNRSELQWEDWLVTNDAPDNINTVTGVALMDPIDNVGAAYVQKFIIDEFDADTDYAPLTLTSIRRMHLQLAESALAGGDMAGFTTHINNLRALDGLTPYSGQMDAMDLLVYSRKANLILEGGSLGDLYRFGEDAPNWQSSSTAASSPGTFLPITNIEILANPNVG